MLLPSMELKSFAWIGMGVEMIRCVGAGLEQDKRKKCSAQRNILHYVRWGLSPWTQEWNSP